MENIFCVIAKNSGDLFPTIGEVAKQIDSFVFVLEKKKAILSDWFERTAVSEKQHL